MQNCFMQNTAFGFSWFLNLPYLLRFIVFERENCILISSFGFLQIVGHSLGGGTAALLTYVLREQKELSTTTCVTFAPGLYSLWTVSYMCFFLFGHPCLLGLVIFHFQPHLLWSPFWYLHFHLFSWVVRHVCCSFRLFWHWLDMAHAGACMTWELAESGNDFIVSIINGADLVPTFSAASVDDLRAEVCLEVLFWISKTWEYYLKYIN